MTFDPNHPDWTAYALGELSEERKADFDREVETNPEARAFVEDLQAFGEDLSAGLSEDASPELDSNRRAAIGAAARKRPRAKLSVFPLSMKGHLAVAATLTAFVVAGILLQTETNRPTGKARENLAPKEPTVDALLMDEVEVEELSSKSRNQRALNEEVRVDAPAPAEAPALPSRQELAAKSPAPEVDSDAFTVAESMSRPLAMKGLFAGRSAGGRRSRLPSSMGILPETRPSPSFGPSLEDYDAIEENDFRRTQDHPLSTFSIDVDTASYSNVRRFLKRGERPPHDAVRIEELMNYFSYDYDPPRDGRPFSAAIAMHPTPWNSESRLLRIGLKGREIAREARPACNLVFLLDVSGSMNTPNKLPLVKRALQMLVNHLDERDRVAIVVYAGASGLVLPSTACDDPQAILDALDRLKAGGSTNGGAGIELAYATAQQHFIEGGVNRVILCTDGDFNVGVVQSGDLVRMVQEKAEDGVFLSVLGFGMGNLKDSTLEQIANKGNGQYAYIDTFSEARKVLVDEMTGTLVTIAKDVKIQVEFNPAHVSRYRLIGYENRMLRKEDFNDDTKDAGEIGAGHTVTALYELIPAGSDSDAAPAVDPLKYQAQPEAKSADVEGEWLTLKLRYKQPGEDRSSRIEFPFRPADTIRAEPDADFRFASAVAEFGMLLRNSTYKGSASFDQVIDRAGRALGRDPNGYRREFLELARNAAALTRETQADVDEVIIHVE